jgi:hypothetical protein
MNNDRLVSACASCGHDSQDDDTRCRRCRLLDILYYPFLVLEDLLITLLCWATQTAPQDQIPSKPTAPAATRNHSPTSSDDETTTSAA